MKNKRLEETLPSDKEWAELIRQEAAKGPDACEEMCEREPGGWTLLMKAAQNGRTETVQSLAEIGADVNAKTDKGMTAFLLAAQYGHPGTAKALAELGADISVKYYENGKPALDYIENIKLKKEIIQAAEEYIKNHLGEKYVPLSFPGQGYMHGEQPYDWTKDTATQTAATKTSTPKTATSETKKDGLSEKFKDFVKRTFLDKKFLSQLGAAMLLLSSFAEKQTQNEHLDGKTKQAIVQIGTLGMSLIRLELNDGNESTDFKFKTPLSEIAKEVVNKLSKEAPAVRLYDYDVNKTPAEKEQTPSYEEPVGRLDIYEENPIAEAKKRSHMKKTLNAMEPTANQKGKTPYNTGNDGR